MNNVSVVGLGKLGVCMAAALASKGIDVLGVDVNPRTVSLVDSGQPPVFEPHLPEVMEKARGHLRATSEFARATLETDITFIVVPTPSEEHGGFSLKYVRAAAVEIGRALTQKSAHHLIVLTSTVLPGSSEYGVIPILEEESGKRCGRDFGFCYGPEFIALGSVIHDFLNPDFVLIGEFDSNSGERLAAVYRKACSNTPPMARMSIVNAELAKIAVNTYVTMKITFANMLAQICEELPGGDVDAVTSALGLDGRIGPRYLKGALGYGGPCFPRDNLALSYFARELGQQATLPEAVDGYNRRLAERLAARISASVSPHGVVAVLGLAYKPDTTVVEESQGLRLAQLLASNGSRVVVYDRVAVDAARQVLGDRVTYARSLEDCLEPADVVVIANPDKEFNGAKLAELSKDSRPAIVDVWRLMRQYENDGRTNYQAVGLGNHSEHVVSRLRALWSPSERSSAAGKGG
jgi:UDPglucose 6-dehydrogenase